jgi:hypothetical protein
VRRVALVLLLLAALAPAARAGEGPDPAARLSRASDASEHWDVMARFDSGHRFVARFLITNEGPGEHTAVAVGHVVFPDGRVVEMRNGRRRHRWEIDEPRLRLDIGSSLLDLHGPVRTLVYDNDRRGIEIRLAFESSGLSSAGPAAAAGGYRVDVLDLCARVTGTLWTRDMPAPLAVQGHASLVHTWMEQSEPALVLHRLDFASLDPTQPVWFHDRTSPEGVHSARLIVARPDGIVHQFEALEASREPGGSADADPEYPIPARLRLRSSELEGSIALERSWLQRDPLGDLPQPFRFLLSFRTRPRRVWADSIFELKLQAGSGRSPLQARGTGIAAVTYLNPLPSPATTTPRTKPGV